MGSFRTDILVDAIHTTRSDGVLAGYFLGGILLCIVVMFIFIKHSINKDKDF